MKNYYLAIDIGASSGRHILGYIENEKIITEQIYRFDNNIINNKGELCWDLNKLFQEIKLGLKKCKEINKLPISIGIDTWAVDYVLLDKENNILGNTISYRDSRTNEMDKEVQKFIPEEILYNRTGIQKQIFNTIYQLMSVKIKNSVYMERADSMLLIPDYFNYLLTNIKQTEYTNATTTQLINSLNKNWDRELINILGFPEKIFPKVNKAGSTVGFLTNEIQKEIGFNCRVINPATHDTGSAVLAVPSACEDILYISSGTWSLIGIERKYPDCSEKSRLHNFTNEGGYQHRFRYLKNVMGLWIIQSIKREIGKDFSFEEICDMASKEKITSIVDCNDKNFLAPKSMTKEIQIYCRRTKQKIPKSIAEIACVIYNSLAKCYAQSIEEIEKITGKSFKIINVVGGGSNADYLNKLTAKYTKKQVQAGPTEATAIGNLIVQMIKNNELASLEAARNCVKKSFNIKTFIN